MIRYEERFDEGQNGWFGTYDNIRGPMRLKRTDGSIHLIGPWWVDYNHAPPGAGYMNLLMGLYTAGPQTEAVKETAGCNRFVQGQYPTDFRNAKLTMRAKGSMELQGTKPMFLIQGMQKGHCVGWLLTSQPFTVTQDWSSQTIVFEDDASKWTALGSRHDRTDMYGYAPLSDVLANVNVNIYLVLYPVCVVPKSPQPIDTHKMRAGFDYPLWQHKLPDGYWLIDTITIEFSQNGRAVL